MSDGTICTFFFIFRLMSLNNRMFSTRKKMFELSIGILVENLHYQAKGKTVGISWRKHIGFFFFNRVTPKQDSH